MKKFVVGQKVRYVSAKEHDKNPETCPKVGTVGTVKKIGGCTFLVQWPNGSTSFDDLWWHASYELESVSKPDDANDRFRMIRRHEALVETVNRVNMIHNRHIYVDWTATRSSMVFVKEWNKESRNFSIYSSV